MMRTIRSVLVFLALYSVGLGVVYPCAVTAFAEVVFSQKAHGSVLYARGTAVGSALVGQQFTGPKYFWGRPSATTPAPCNASSSGASQLGPTNPALRGAVQAQVERLRSSDPGNSLPIPVDLVTTSASGLDPHISPAAAFYQVPRVSRLRGLPESEVRVLVREHIESRWPGAFGDPRVNVLRLNLALDSMSKNAPR